MKSIEKFITCEIEMKNSRFICCMYPIQQDSISSILNEVKKQYPKATHYCYGYIYDSVKHSSDDGEPTGTAGFPILNVLEKEDLNHVLCVVIRYFGGIKLGAGGLVRAYTKSVTEALKEATFIELISGYKIEIQFPYEEENSILYILNQSEIIDKKYLETITYTVLVDRNTYQKLLKYQPTILEELFIKERN